MARPRSIPQPKLRNGVFYLRYFVPSDLRDVFGKNEIWMSLKTREKSEAAQRIVQIAARIEDEMERIRQQHFKRLEREKARELDVRIQEKVTRDSVLEHLEDGQIRDLARAYFGALEGGLDDRRKELRSLAKQVVRTSDPVERQILLDKRKELRTGAQELLAALKDTRSGGGGSEHVPYESQQHAILGEARSVLKHYRISNSEGSAQFELLKDWVLEAMITQQERFVSVLENERAENDQRFIDPASSSPYEVDVDKVLGRHRGDRLDQPTIFDLIDDYVGCPTRGKAGRPLSAKTKLLDSGRLETIAELVGISRPAGSISQDDLIKLRERLVRLPANYKKMGLGSNAAEAVKNARDTDQKLSVGGVNAYMNTIRGFLVWCMKRKHIQHVPDFTNTQLHDIRPEHARRLPFKSADLKTFFEGDIYAKTVGSSSWKYWGPLLGLYHGLRLGEVCQLNPEDICQTGDVWCVHITASARRGIADKKLKTMHSERLLPMHPILVHLGLPKYAASRPEAEKLFSDVLQGGDGHYSSVASKAFRRMLDDSGLRGSKETFHSFRHNFTAAMEDANLPSSAQDWLGGWAGTTKSERRRYRSRPGIGELRVFIERVSFPEVDPILAKLSPWAA